MRKRSWCLGLAALLVLGSAGVVQAEEYTSDQGWKVEFTGKEMVSNFSSSEISEAVYALQPGDQVTIRLALANGSQREVDWYMTNEVLSSLEDHSEEARGGAYAYHLSYTDGAGAVTTLYSSENVGGEKDAKAGLGLREATDGLGEYVQLDRMAAGGTGAVELTVALDGETQGNGYQNTLADLRMNFAVEPGRATGGGSGGSGSGGSGGSDGSSGSGGGETPDGGSGALYTTGSVQTGDTSNLIFWSAAALLSGLLLLFLAVRGFRRDRGGEGHE